MVAWVSPHDWVADEDITEALADQMFKDNPTHLKEDRDFLVANRDAGTLAVGDVVILDIANTGVEKVSTDSHAGPVYVVDTTGPTAVGVTLYVHGVGCRCLCKVNGT